MKYKVGDMVKIKRDLDEGDCRESRIYCAPPMLSYRGVTARVTSMRYFEDSIPLYSTCQTGYWEWADDMLEEV